MARAIRTCWLVCAGLLLALGLPAPDLGAYDTFGDGYGSKWDDPNFGTGAVVTWSFVTPGTGLSSNPAISFLSGTNTLGGGDPAWDIRYKIDNQFGAGAFDAAVQRALDTWARVANLSFVQVADSGQPFAGGTTPDIRIAAYHFPENDIGAGATWGPPGDDLQFPDALSGDLVLNDRNRFTIAPGPDGTPIPTDQGTYLNDLEGLILHELGHALGLGHTDVIAGVLCGYIYPGDVWNGSLCDYTHVNHDLHPDDVAGIREIYGIAPIPVPIPPTAGIVLGILLAAVGARESLRRNS